MKKSEKFFQLGPAKDCVYVNVRRKARPDPATRRKAIGDRAAEEAHEFCEGLWAEYTCPDSTFRSDAKNHFQQRFWEMYLCVAHKRKGFNPVKSGFGDEGPEFYFMVGEKKVWVEAIAPDRGTGTDAVPKWDRTKIYDEHTNEIILRYTHALSTKLEAYNEAVQKGLIGHSDCYIVAINCNLIPTADMGFIVPYPAKAYLGIGDYTVVMNRDTNKVVDRHFKFQEQIAKENGAPVNTAPFLSPEYAGISGVLHSAVDVLNHPPIMGGDFKFLHNPLASQPIERSVFSFCRQYIYSRERGELQTVEPDKVGCG